MPIIIIGDSQVCIVGVRQPAVMRANRRTVERNRPAQTGNLIGLIRRAVQFSQCAGAEEIIPSCPDRLLELGGRLNSVDEGGKILHIMAKNHRRVVRVRPGAELGHRQLRSLKCPFDGPPENHVSIHAGIESSMSD